LPHLYFFYIVVVLVAILCICYLIQEKIALEQELEQWQDKARKFQDELHKINRYAEHYQTTPEIVAAVVRECEKYAVEPSIMLELIKVESNFKPDAISKHGARGLCQIRPVTAKAVAAKMGLEYSAELLLDAEYSIKLGTYHLAELIQLFGQDYHKALTAYNRGIQGMIDYTRRTGSPVSSYSKRIQENRLTLAI